MMTKLIIIGVFIVYTLISFWMIADDKERWIDELNRREEDE